MSGHSKWHSIKHKKGAADAARGKIFTQVAKIVTIAAQNGGDPDMNPALRTAIEKAKAVNMPNANIERAIKKGTGELKDGNVLEEVIYEGYGPGGVAIYIQCITDNKNRAVSDVKSILSKNGGRMGSAGCTAWMFEQKGVLLIDASDHDPEEIELSAIDAGALDVKVEDSSVEIVTAPQDFSAVKSALKQSGYTVLSAEITFIPKEEVTVSDEKTARQLLKLIDQLEYSDDVSHVASNFDIAEEIMEKM